MIPATQTMKIKVSTIQNTENALHKLPGWEEQNRSATQTRKIKLLHETTKKGKIAQGPDARKLDFLKYQNGSWTFTFVLVKVSPHQENKITQIKGRGSQICVCV